MPLKGRRQSGLRMTLDRSSRPSWKSRTRARSGIFKAGNNVPTQTSTEVWLTRWRTSDHSAVDVAWCAGAADAGLFILLYEETGFGALGLGRLHRKPSKRAKSPSKVIHSQPNSMAKAARYASVIRLPRVSASR